MDNEKIVVALLLITIILSIVSVVVTLTADAGGTDEMPVRSSVPDDGVGRVGFQIIPGTDEGGNTN